MKLVVTPVSKDGYDGKKCERRTEKVMDGSICR